MIIIIKVATKSRSVKFCRKLFSIENRINYFIRHCTAFFHSIRGVWMYNNGFFCI